jgi:hypothetical protein
MRTKESNSSPEKVRRPARDVINAVLENMRANLEPLKYSTLAPSRYVVYLHPAEYGRLEGILVILRQQTMRALSEEVAALNRPPMLRQYARRLFRGREREARIENAAGDWTIEFFPNADGDMTEGDILVDSELLLPASPELGIGERTRLVTTLHSGQRTTSRRRIVSEPGDSGKPSDPAGVQRTAVIEYEDNSGRHSYEVRRSVTIGRGGLAYPVDVKVVSSADVSRQHARIRRDDRTGDFFLIDLSTLGTTLNGRHVPRGYEENDGHRKPNGAETLLPDQARIGLADTVYLSFSVVRQ